MINNLLPGQLLLEEDGVYDYIDIRYEITSGKLINSEYWEGLIMLLSNYILDRHKKDFVFRYLLNSTIYLKLQVDTESFNCFITEMVDDLEFSFIKVSNSEQERCFLKMTYPPPKVSDFTSSDRALIKMRDNGDTIIYDPEGELFVIKGDDGKVKEMYILDPEIHGYSSNLKYFNTFT